MSPIESLCEALLEKASDEPVECRQRFGAKESRDVLLEDGEMVFVEGIPDGLVARTISKEVNLVFKDGFVARELVQSFYVILIAATITHHTENLVISTDMATRFAV